MFKKFMAIVLAMVFVTGCAVTADASCPTENDRPTIIGADLGSYVAELNEQYREGNDVNNQPYVIEMVCVEDIWFVAMEGTDDFDGYGAIGFYDHMPNDEDIEILWCNRMTRDELTDLMGELGF